MPTTLRDTETVKQFYDLCYETPTAIAPHLPTLRHFASKCAHSAEFGVKRGASSSALLLGSSRVSSWDIQPTQEAIHLQGLAGDRWNYQIGDSTQAVLPLDVDLLFIDSLHTYQQVAKELMRGLHVRKFLIFHDTMTFGTIGADGETGRPSWDPGQGGYSASGPIPAKHWGVMPAILEFMSIRPEWKVLQHNPESHGLLVLENTN